MEYGRDVGSRTYRNPSKLTRVGSWDGGLVMIGHCRIILSLLVISYAAACGSDGSVPDPDPCGCPGSELLTADHFVRPSAARNSDQLIVPSATASCVEGTLFGGGCSVDPAIPESRMFMNGFIEQERLLWWCDWTLGPELNRLVIWTSCFIDDENDPPLPADPTCQCPRI